MRGAELLPGGQQPGEMLRIGAAGLEVHEQASGVDGSAHRGDVRVAVTREMAEIRSVGIDVDAGEALRRGAGDEIEHAVARLVQVVKAEAVGVQEEMEGIHWVRDCAAISASNARA